MEKNLCGELADFYNNIINYDSSLVLLSKEEMVSLFSTYCEVLYTIKISELQMLVYLRNSQNGESSRFGRLAKRNYEIYQETLKLNRPL